MTVLKGALRAIHCIEVGRAVDLDRARTVLVASRETTFHHRRAFPAAKGVRAPVRMSWATEPLTVGALVTGGTAEVAVYEAGVLAITWSFDASGAPADMIEPWRAVDDAGELEVASRALAATVLGVLGDAVDRPEPEGELEDYVLFEGRVQGTDAPLLEWARHEAATLAGILRSPTVSLSAQERDDALLQVISYGEDDLSILDWAGAILIGDDMADERVLLELANVELLGLRSLDDDLDREMRSAYRLLSAGPRGPFGWTSLRRELDRLAHRQAEDALLHQGIDNALGLFGDDYLARFYRAAAARFHFDEQDLAIQRKLGVIERIYTSLEAQASHRRSEVLEWIIIVLIAVDIVIHFFP